MKNMKAIAAALVMFVLVGATAAYAGGTAPGTVITNTATATYTVGVTTVSTNSNTTSLTVAELIDVNVLEEDAAKTVLVAPSDLNKMMTFRVTNTGNGTETFALSTDLLVLGDDFNPTASLPTSVYLDTNGNDVYDGADSAYVFGTNDPTIAADAHKTVFVFSDIPAGVLDTNAGKVSLTAASTNGTGAPGASLGMVGDAGSEAVAGASGGDGLDTGSYLVSNVTVTVVKTQVVTDQFGGAKPMPGATIHYTITVKVTAGTGTATGLALKDPLPANTTYTAGTLKLDAVALSDALDGDVGDVNGTTPGSVTVNIGSLTSASPIKTVTFDVTIN